MLLLLGVAFVAGLVTAVSPCVLPVLPVLFAGSASGGRRRPYAIVAGLVLSFTVFTLAAAALLSALGLPDDLLRNVAIAVVALVGLSLLWPRLGDVVERPFAALGRRRPGDIGGGFLLGVNLGLLFTPCAGPVIAAIAVLAATRSLTLDAVLVTFAYALGAGLVLLALAVAGQRGFSMAWLRARAPLVRRALGGVIVGVVVIMALGLDIKLAAKVPGYTRSLQRLEESAAAQSRLDRLLDRGGPLAQARLEDFGPAPDFRQISLWLNSKPLTLASLRGKVVLVDFWTYSCINCLRTLPHVKSWYRTYRDAGLVVVGVHTPEFAFERVPANVRGALDDLGIEYPVALDNDYGTWDAYLNRYWPAKYLIDRRGHLRFAHFGEGAYDETEHVIRALLAEQGLPTPVSRSLPDETPTGAQTPETYLGYGRIERFIGSEIAPNREADYRIPPLVPVNEFAYGGRWKVEEERIVAGANARLRLAFHARQVFLVLGTSGVDETVDVALDGKALDPLSVTADRLYTLARVPGEPGDHVLELAFSPGTEAYAFTFG
jgi:cytochrome c biogenesis protein CcdA/thiol-disulfide isomerase/thioredoxin